MVLWRTTIESIKTLKDIELYFYGNFLSCDAVFDVHEGA